MMRMRKMNQFLLLFLVSCLFFVSLSHASSASTQRCIPDQSSALLQLKREFHIRKPSDDLWYYHNTSYPKMKSWTADTDCCSWDGVTCNTKTGLVVGLDLSDSWLNGSLNPNSSLFTLRHLQKLNLAFNDFNGSTIPSEFGHLAKLSHLNLSGSTFSGQIPSEISQLINLVSLDLSWNYDSEDERVYLRRMDLEALVKNMTNLEELHLDYVNISSSIPQFLVNLSSSLTSLSLSECGLHGPLHPNSSLFSLRHLQKLNLAFNDFNFSTIPSEFGQLARLTHLDLSSSRFSGQIPLEISWLTSLLSLDLSQNYDYEYNQGLFLKRVDLEELGKNLTNLEDLNLNEVNISSSVPQFLVNLSSLTSLSLSSCSLLGEFPKNIFLLPKIQAIRLSYNQFLSGVLPEFPSSSSLKQLFLIYTNFSGKLPNSISNLKSLNVLYLYDCNFSGLVPPSLGNLSQLTYLSLSNNHFHGQLPFTLGNLAKLTDLNLVGNIFDGKIPSFLGNLTQLQNLDLSYNNLNGEFPISLTNLTQLIELDLRGNQLIGPIPSEISRIVHLESLDLSNNSLTGAILLSLFTIPSLRSLDLAQNQLVGPLEFQNVSSSNLEFLLLSGNKFNEPIPRSISNLTNLRYLFLSLINVMGIMELNIFFKLEKLIYLDISGNNLSISNINSTFLKFEYLNLASCNIREFPDFLKTQDELWRLNLSNNKIEGKIPKWFWNVGTETLTFLDLSHNLLSSFEQPPTLLPWKQMSYLDLRSNLLNDLLPIPPVSTNYFFASENNLTGRIHPAICKLSSLEILDLSNNSLSGPIPRCLGNSSSSLSILNLRMNSFQGKLPLVFTNESSLRTLDFSYNQIQGKIPQSLVNCKELEVLNLGNNNMNDTFPFWLESLPELKILVLRENGFHGPMLHLQTKSGFSKLRIIDLSYNSFTGELPFEYFKTWNAMLTVRDEEKSKMKYMGDDNGYYKDSLTLMNKGIEMVFVKILTIFIAIDLSNNRFHGEIPDTIGNLKALIVLNLSSNSFTGLIPSSLGSLTELESLDLSQNKLLGEIPRQLTSLTFLSCLDLSQNQLVGPIPQGAQFGTFPNSSFEGNLALCGSPLSKKCENSETPTSEQGQESSFTEGFSWKVVAMGYACGLLVGLVTGHVITTRRPGWLSRTFGVNLRRRR